MNKLLLALSLVPMLSAYELSSTTRGWATVTTPPVAGMMEAEPNARIPKPLSLSIEKERQLDVTPEKPVKTRLRRQGELNARIDDVEGSEVVSGGVHGDMGKDVYARLSSPGVNSSARLYRKMEEVKTRRMLQMEGGVGPPSGSMGLILNPDFCERSRALKVRQ